MNRIPYCLSNFSSSKSTPIQWIKNKLNLKNTRGQLIFNDIEAYIFGNQFNSSNNHTICRNSMRSNSNQIQFSHSSYLACSIGTTIALPKNYLIKQQLESILYKSASNYIYQFDDNYNQEMKQELERNQEVLQFVLDDYYNYQFKKKSLEQIVFEDILLRQQCEKQKQTKYVLTQPTMYFYSPYNFKYNHMLKYDQGVLRGENEKILWVE